MYTKVFTQLSVLGSRGDPHVMSIIKGPEELWSHDPMESSID